MFRCDFLIFKILMNQIQNGYGTYGGFHIGGNVHGNEDLDENYQAMADEIKLVI